MAPHRRPEEPGPTAMDNVRFDARDLTPWAAYVTTDQLNEGQIYFHVAFIDDEALIPILEPWVFIGHNLEAGDESKVYFQDAASYLEGSRAYPVTTQPQDSEAQPVLYCGPNDQEHVFTYERALEVLMRCSLRRAKQEQESDSSA